MGLSKGHQFKKSQIFYSYTLVLQLHKSSHEGRPQVQSVAKINIILFFCLPDLPNIKITKINSLFSTAQHFPFRRSAVSVKQSKTIGYCPMMTACKQLGFGLCTHFTFYYYSFRAVSTLLGI